MYLDRIKLGCQLIFKAETQFGDHEVKPNVKIQCLWFHVELKAMYSWHAMKLGSADLLSPSPDVRQPE